jgi:hypothetical protein
MLIQLTGSPTSDVVVDIGQGHVLVSYDRKGCLRLMREAKGGQPPAHKPKPDETVFRVTDFPGGEATLKSSGGHCGFFSVNGLVYWSTIWDDVGPEVLKKCAFQDWVVECAQVLAGVKKQVSST